MAAAMIATGFIGTVIGRQVLTRIGQRYFQTILNSIILILAARLVWTAVEGVMAG